MQATAGHQARKACPGAALSGRMHKRDLWHVAAVPSWGVGWSRGCRRTSAHHTCGARANAHLLWSSSAVRPPAEWPTTTACFTPSLWSSPAARRAPPCAQHSKALNTKSERKNPKKLGMSRIEAELHMLVGHRAKQSPTINLRTTTTTKDAGCEPQNRWVMHWGASGKTTPLGCRGCLRRRPPTAAAAL